MHMIIRNIVYADSKKEALSVARENFKNLCKGQRIFDYYDMFDDGGSAYWGDRCPEISLLNKPEGRKMIVGGWKATLRDMREHLREIKKTYRRQEDYRSYARYQKGLASVSLSFCW